MISPEGEQLGIMSIRDALRAAQERELDLVEVAPNARPPVCRIMDYVKYKYEQTKRQKEARKKQKVIAIKEVRMSPKIEEHDFQVKVKNAERFLKDGNKVKVSVRFRGREVVHSDLAKEMLLQMAKDIEHIAKLDRQPAIEGRQMIMILSPNQDSGKRRRYRLLKLKTHRGAAKRLKATGSGKFKKNNAYRRHNLGKKSQKQKRQLRHAVLVSDADQKRAKRLMPYV